MCAYLGYEVPYPGVLQACVLGMGVRQAYSSLTLVLAWVMSGGGVLMLRESMVYSKEKRFDSE